MAAADDLLVAFEYHSPEMIRDALAAGADPRALIKGKTPIDCLIEMYLRSKRFAGLPRGRCSMPALLSMIPPFGGPSR